ncbi:MAG TPA: DUF5317 family protein [Chloroflexota bacterium]|nr:DUF5317 family protein [Chloroflexota bacterium]
MFFVLAVLAAVLIAALRGCSLERVVSGRFSLVWCPIVGIILHLVVALPWFAVPLALAPLGSPWPLGAILYVTSFVLLILFLLANLGRPGFIVLLLGLGLNLLEIILNGGHMPGDPHQLAVAGFLTGLQREQAAGLWSQFSVVGPNTPLPFLADRIYVPLPFREPVILSVGDFIIAIGCLLFFNDVPIRWGRSASSFSSPEIPCPSGRGLG